MTAPIPRATRISESLRRAGLRVPPDELRPERHDERWLVRLPGRRLAWLPASPEGREGLARETRLLRLLGERCTFELPRSLYTDPAGELEVRSVVGVRAELSRLLPDLRASPELEREIGERLGRMLAEQHTRIGHDDVRGWIPESLRWPWGIDRVLAGMETAAPERRDLRTAAAEVYARRAALALDPAELALVHTDVGFHNLAFAEDGWRVIGLFDYDSAAWADRHYDFVHLLWDGDRVDLVRALIASYERQARYALAPDRILLYNAAHAFTYLAYRAGYAPHERPCGRTLAEDLAWCEWAADNVLTGRAARLFG